MTSTGYHPKGGLMMRFGCRAVVSLVVAAVLGGTPGLGCAGRASQGGGGGSGGTTHPGAGGTTDASALDGPLVEPCPQSPAPLRKTGTTLSLPIAPMLEGRPFVSGETSTLASGAKVTALNFRFYVSHVALLQAGGARLPVDLVTATGAVEPYGVHLFNADEADTQALRVLAPPGTYSGLELTVGLDDACNSGVPGQRTPPLTDTSQMTWPHAAGYLFLRLEDQLDVSGAATTGTVAIPTLVHMGGVPGALFAPTVTVAGALVLAAGAPTTK